LKNIEDERQRQLDYDLYRRQGELILSNFRKVKRGMGSAVLLDYAADPPCEVSVPLEPRLNPQDNAERYFNKHKKARRGLEHSERRCSETHAELEWLAQAEYQLESAESGADVLSVAADLRSAGIFSKTASDRFARPVNSKASHYSEIVSPNGFKVLWGRSSRQNDYLSTRMLKKGDLWFHAHRCPGAHVVIKGTPGGKDYTEEDIAFAASLAAGYSKAGRDAKVEVMIVEPKALQKPKGARPGMVKVQSHKIIVVQPFKPTEP
jgi:predicted ribosome quality control (RQC) complex YloA/Tae2 family protein